LVGADLIRVEENVKLPIKELIASPGFVGALAVDNTTFTSDYAVAIMRLSGPHSAALPLS